MNHAGIGSNFVYSHSHVATSTSYLQQQKGPEGIAFGGDIGKERLFLDEDFMHLIIRHHAVDKTYEAGHLLPNQVILFLFNFILFNSSLLPYFANLEVKSLNL